MIENHATRTYLEHNPAAPSRRPARSSHPSVAMRSRRRVSFFIHEPFGPPRTSSLRIGVIADGTTRGGPNGIAEGAKRVVECAERCAERADVALLAAFVLSPQNVARRKRVFFSALHAEFLRLLEGVTSGRVLAGIRIEIHGRLDRLVKKGGAAARLAHVLELLVEATEAIQSPRLRLVFCIDYDEDTPLAIGLDTLIRTGMEAHDVLRLSGLRVPQYTLCIPQVKLWRDFTAADLDDALALASRHARLGLAPGFSSAFLTELLSELTRADLNTPLQITLPLAASVEETTNMLEIAAGLCVNRASGVAVTATIGPRGELRRVGPRDAPVQVRIVAPRLRLPGRLDEPSAWIAPGQPSPVFQLLERSAGDANVHTCEPTPAGVVEGLRRALRFQAAHPPLHGAPRSLRRDEQAGWSERVEDLVAHVSVRLDTPAGVIARELDGRDEPTLGRTGEVFAAQCVSAARAAGLVSGEVEWRRQAFGYAMTAFAIGVRPRHSLDAADREWEPTTRELARVMLALASSDEEITDRVFEGEDEGARRARLAASIDYLIARIHGVPRELPEVYGMYTLHAIGGEWERFFELSSPAADASLLSGVKRAAEALYRANIEELSRIDPRVASLARRPSASAAGAVERRYATSAPEPIARRIRELLHVVMLEPWQGKDASWRELRLLCRLARVAPSIGAGCALLAMAATEPAHAIPAGGAAAFLRATPLLDHYFRLVNDLAFADATRGDRDAKVNTFTCLVPAGLAGKARERACVEALGTCRAIAAWLREQVESAADELSRLWPLGARWLQRGFRVGRRVYEIGHYERLDPDTMSGIIAELEPPAENAR